MHDGDTAHPMGRADERHLLRSEEECKKTLRPRSAGLLARGLELLADDPALVVAHL
jgi:hypothetical protein